MESSMGELVSNPLGTIDALFQLSKNEADYSSIDAVATRKIQDRFHRFAADVKNYSSIPRLDAHTVTAQTVRSNQTVRYRGLIQDIFDIEYFVGIAKDSSGSQAAYLKYRDISGDSGLSEEDAAVLERLPLFCVPVPGESGWALCHGAAAPAGRKRPLDCAEAMDTGSAIDGAMAETRLKSQRVEAEPVPAHEASHTAAAGQPGPVNAPQATAGRDVNCLVKLYDFRQAGGADSDESSPAVRLNDMIEVVGVLSTYVDPGSEMEADSDPNAMTMSMIGGDPFFGFESAAATPAKLVNVHTVHCLIYRKLCSAYPLYVAPSSGSREEGLSRPLQGNVFCDAEQPGTLSLAHSVCYESLVRRLSSALGGDAVSAAYVALSVVSSVSGRAPGDVALGAVAVNINGIQPGDARVEKIIEVLRDVIPRVMQVRLDREALAENGGFRFFAEKSTATECIDRSCLQLGPGTALVVDETRMTEGPISPNGVRSMKALESVVKSQLLPVDFEYCPGIKIPTDVCVIILSNSPSIIGDNVIKSFSPSLMFSAKGSNAEDAYGHSMDVIADVGSGEIVQDIDAIRHWWGHCKLSDASLEEHMVRFVEEDFVHARQGAQHRSAVSSETVVPVYPVEATDFHNWLTLARLLAIAEGSRVITPLQWSKIRQLEAERYHNRERFTAQLTAVVQ